jgi:hypothetical protein
LDLPDEVLAVLLGIKESPESYNEDD